MEDAKPSRPYQARYRAVIDELAVLLEKDGALSAEDEEWKRYLLTIPDADRYQASAFRKLKFSLKECLRIGRCPYCWVLRESCYCEEIPETPCDINFVVLYHPNELFRSSSTGKLVCQMLGGRLMMYGYENEEIHALIDDPNTYLLFPDETSVTLDDLCPLDSAPEAACAAWKKEHKKEAASKITVVVLDGTWGQARMLFSIIKKINPSIKRLRLDLSQAEVHESMFNALRKQSEAGRVSTFEACMLLLDEVGADTGPLEDMFKRFISILTFEKHRATPFEKVSQERVAASHAAHLRRQNECIGLTRIEKNGVKKTTDVEVETWVELMRKAAHRILPPPVVRYCCHCELFVTPARMLEHVQGRMHNFIIAKRHLGRPEGRSGSRAPHGNRERALLVTQAMADKVTQEATNTMLGV